MKTLVRAAALGLALMGSTALSAQAQTMPMGDHGDHMAMMRHGPMLSVSAYGEARVAPDMASITLGVVTEAPTAAEALRQNSTRMNQVIAALKRQGIAERDIQTSGLNIQAQYTYRENQPPELRGYQVSNVVTVTVYDLGKVGQAVDAVVSAGGNQVNGISFGLRDPQKAEDAARLEAVKRLQAKASLYAGAVGKPIKKLVTLSEGGGYQPSPPVPMMAFRDKAASAESTPVASGELVLRVDVQAVYELEE